MEGRSNGPFGITYGQPLTDETGVGEGIGHGQAVVSSWLVFTQESTL
jgi:hypothetical protein